LTPSLGPSAQSVLRSLCYYWEDSSEVTLKLSLHLCTILCGVYHRKAFRSGDCKVFISLLRKNGLGISDMAGSRSNHVERLLHRHIQNDGTSRGGQEVDPLQPSNSIAQGIVLDVGAPVEPVVDYNPPLNPPSERTNCIHQEVVQSGEQWPQWMPATPSPEERVAALPMPREPADEQIVMEGYPCAEISSLLEPSFEF